MFKTNDIITHFAYKVVLNVLTEFRRNLINDGHSLAGFLSLSMYLRHDDDMLTVCTDAKTVEAEHILDKNARKSNRRARGYKTKYVIQGSAIYI